MPKRKVRSRRWSSMFLWRECKRWAPVGGESSFGYQGCSSARRKVGKRGNEGEGEGFRSKNTTAPCILVRDGSGEKEKSEQKDCTNITARGAAFLEEVCCMAPTCGMFPGVPGMPVFINHFDWPLAILRRS